MFHQPIISRDHSRLDRVPFHTGITNKNLPRLLVWDFNSRMLFLSSNQTASKH